MQELLDSWGGAWGTHGKEEKCMQDFGWGTCRNETA